MTQSVFICEDRRSGADFFRRCIKHFLGEVPVWRGEGVTELPKTVTLAKRQYGDAKLIVLADGDALMRIPTLRERLRTQLADLGACGILIAGNAEGLARRCLPADRHGEFDRERAKSKKNAIAFALGAIDWNTAHDQPEFEDIRTVAACSQPTRTVV